MLSPTKRNEGSLSPMQSHFLQRLSRLLKLRSDQNGQLNEDGMLLIDRTIYATYCDAVDIGVTEEAQKLLHRSAAAPAAAAAGK